MVMQNDDSVVAREMRVTKMMRLTRLLVLVSLPNFTIVTARIPSSHTSEAVCMRRSNLHATATPIRSAALCCGGHAVSSMPDVGQIQKFQQKHGEIQGVVYVAGIEGHV
eukprot:jgi/Ulvmu1/1125/UM106_0042.1